jgi:membrane protease YdiL (CAAX protease family)
MGDQNDVAIKSYLDWSSLGKASFWRYLAGFVITIVVFFLLSGFGLIPLALIRPDYQESLTLSIVAKLLAFVITFFAIPLMVKILHQRPAWSVAMPKWGFESWNFFSGFLVSLVVGVVAALLLSLSGMMPVEANPAFKLGVWLPVVLIGFIGIFIQAGAEELVFRGYFTQMIRKFTANKILFIGIPALLFAFPHISNVASFGGSPLAMAPYIISAILYAWGAYRTGSLWMALGLHLSNNYTFLVLIGTKGDVLPSAAPFLVGIPGLAVVTLLTLVQALVVYLILSYLINRRKSC